MKLICPNCEVEAMETGFCPSCQKTWLMPYIVEFSKNYKPEQKKQIDMFDEEKKRRTPYL